MSRVARPLLVAFSLGASLAAQAQTWLGLQPLQNASAFRAQAGQVLSFVCPAGDGGKARLYGTDIYTDDSAICAAAIHAGVLKPGRGGIVKILIGNGAKSFKGSERNGLRSLDYGSWGHSYSFVQDGEPGTITWATVWNGIPADYADPITVKCPPQGDTRKAIWGTDVYTLDSAICVAAAHTGLVDSGKGGLITVRRAPPPKEYPGSERYGVTSQRWGSSADAFSVSVAKVSAPPPPPPPPPSVLSRTVTLAGFTGIGSASQPGAVASRTITLAGFAGVGSASSQEPIGSRTIQTPGWTGVGSAP